MNSELINQIVIHLFKSFHIIPSEYSGNSLISSVYILPEKLKFKELNNIITCSIYGTQVSFGEQKLKILVGSCSSNSSEYAMIIHLDDTPIYGMHLYQDANHLLAYSVDGKSWALCNIYLASTFLAGMEYLKDLGSNWLICSSYEAEYKALLSFIDFCNNLPEDYYEGQED